MFIKHAKGIAIYVYICDAYFCNKQLAIFMKISHKICGKCHLLTMLNNWKKENNLKQTIYYVSYHWQYTEEFSADFS